MATYAFGQVGQIVKGEPLCLWATISLVFFFLPSFILLFFFWGGALVLVLVERALSWVFKWEGWGSPMICVASDGGFNY